MLDLTNHIWTWWSGHPDIILITDGVISQYIGSSLWVCIWQSLKVLDRRAGACPSEQTAAGMPQLSCELWFYYHCCSIVIAIAVAAVVVVVVVAAAAYVIGVAFLIVTAGIVVHPASSHERPFPYLQIAANTKILKMPEMHFWLNRAKHKSTAEYILKDLIAWTRGEVWGGGVGRFLTKLWHSYDIPMT